MGCVFKAHKSERKDIYAKVRIFGILFCYERFGMFKDRKETMGRKGCTEQSRVEGTKVCNYFQKMVRRNGLIY